MSVMCAGLAWETFCIFMHEKAEFFVNNIYNVIDIISHVLYLLSMGFRMFNLHLVSCFAFRLFIVFD